MSFSVLRTLIKSPCNTIRCHKWKNCKQHTLLVASLHFNFSITYILTLSTPICAISHYIIPLVTVIYECTFHVVCYLMLKNFVVPCGAGMESLT